MPVKSAAGTKFDLTNPLNRVRADVMEGGANVTAYVDGSSITVSGVSGEGKTRVRLVYERARSNSTAPWTAVSQFQAIGEGSVVETMIHL